MKIVCNGKELEVYNGKSNYELAVEQGFDGTVEEYLESQKGPKGDDGFSPTVSTSINENQDGVIVTITDVNGEHSFEILNGLDGENGENGQDATINGENTIQIVSGDNISIEQQDSILTISSTGVTMDQVNDAINTAITGAIQEVYYGTDSSTETTV